jgi:hypothetical protein
MKPTEPTPVHTPEDVIKKLSSAIDHYPAGFSGDRLNLLLVQEAEPIWSCAEYWRRMDNPSLCDERREVLVSDEPWPFPVFNVPRKPEAGAVSDALFDHFDYARKVLLTQKAIGAEIARRASESGADVVMLMVVDGLSYYDVPDTLNAQPCLVEGVTTTEFGYREVIGKPSVSQRMFAAGYRNQIGMSFYDTGANPLAASLYSSFGQSQIHRISSFDQCLQILRLTGLNRAFVQIISPGLDEICHKHRDAPPRAEYLHGILEKFNNLRAVVSGLHLKALACLTADHGIIWRDALGEARVIGVERNQDSTHPRYVHGSLLREDLRVVQCGSRSFSLLRAPLLTRELRSTEWGVHGGLSAWESLVPVVFSET